MPAYPGDMMDEMSCGTIEDEGLIERYLAGKLSASETEAFEAHYLTCDRCTSELRLGIAIRAVLPGVQKSSGIMGLGHRTQAGRGILRPGRVGATAAAIAAMLIGILLVQPSSRETSPHRGGVTEMPGVPSVEAPIGDVRAVEEFRWTPVLAADLYRVTVYNATSEVVWQFETGENQISPADSVTFEPGLLYLWQVDARVGWDRWVSSDLVRFSVSGP